ncbi:hypothetical protein, partial [Hydrotalea sp.]|uniref:hypothetical protein n=1 Tax=Hydrotalea sp. TaxID=2881279 RepID=UPI00259073EA
IEKYKIGNSVTAANVYKIVKEIQNIYNNSYHNSIKNFPEKIINENIKIENKNKNKNIISPNLHIGDEVRIYIKNENNPFNKISPLWSKHIYTIKNYNNRTGYYTFDGLDKQFKYNDLQKIDINNLMSFNISER